MSVIRPVDESRSPRGVLITGAAGGIGLAVAKLAAHQGRSVAMLDRDPRRVNVAAAELRENGAIALGLACDVRDEAELDAAFRSAVSELGPLTGVVASAGIDRAGEAHELPVESWDDVIETNLRGAFLTCRAALREMLPRGGSIVCISSPLAFVAPAGGAGAYAASKAGVSALVRSLAVDYGRHGIRVNAVLPGPTETDLMWANVPKSEVQRMRAVVADEVPLGRLANPHEPARAVMWLLSDDASYVTGAQLACDGGVLAKASVSV